MLKLLLYPFSLLYGLAVDFRNRLYDFKILSSREFEVPVVSIGNITVGGTGKTPHTEYLVKLLRDRYRVATLSRGYRRKSKGFRMVEISSEVQEAGDEPLQVKRKFPEVQVAVCENRVTGVERLLSENPPPDVVILDDAFQHRRITPGINILLIDYNRPLKEDLLLPAGRLRERESQVRRANIIIITKCPSEITPITRRIMEKEVNLFPYQDLYFTTLVYGQLLPVFPEGKPMDLFSNTREMGVLVVTGIAAPETIVDHLSSVSSEIDTAIFPDHHYFTAKDIQLIMHKFEKLASPKKIIVTTEKDTMRFRDVIELPEKLRSVLYCLPVQVRFLDRGGKHFDQKILDYVGENKSNRELHHRKNRLQA